MDYWDLVEPIWEAISIYDGPENFLRQYNSAPEAARTLFAAHWCQSEICNGGFDQFFSNSTGVLAPEAVVAFQKIGMLETAALVERAMLLLGDSYPRDRDTREEAIETAWEASSDQENGPFGDMDPLFFTLIKEECGGFGNAADAFASEH